MTLLDCSYCVSFMLVTIISIRLHTRRLIIITVFTQIVAIATINFGPPRVRLLNEGGSYSRAATIQGVATIRVNTVDMFLAMQCLQLHHVYIYI